MDFTNAQGDQKAYKFFYGLLRSQVLVNYRFYKGVKMVTFTRNIPIERFDSIKVSALVKNSDVQITGIASVNLIDSEVSIRETDEFGSLWVIPFDEIENLRFVASGMVRDCYWDEPGDLVHVPGLGEWNKNVFHKNL
jgi:hypothetical protein